MFSPHRLTWLRDWRAEGSGRWLGYEVHDAAVGLVAQVAGRAYEALAVSTANALRTELEAGGARRERALRVLARWGEAAVGEGA